MFDLVAAVSRVLHGLPIFAWAAPLGPKAAELKRLIKEHNPPVEETNRVLVAISVMTSCAMRYHGLRYTVARETASDFVLNFPMTIVKGDAEITESLWLFLRTSGDDRMCQMTAFMAFLGHLGMPRTITMIERASDMVVLAQQSLKQLEANAQKEKTAEPDPKA